MAVEKLFNQVLTIAAQESKDERTKDVQIDFIAQVQYHGKLHSNRSKS